MMHVIEKFPSRIVPQVLKGIEQAGQMAYVTTLWRTMLDLPCILAGLDMETKYMEMM